jgi:Leucine-rich repeat (LRR) protein
MRRALLLAGVLASACRSEPGAPAPPPAPASCPPPAPSAEPRKVDDDLPFCCSKTGCTAIAVDDRVQAALEAIPDRAKVRLFLGRGTRSSDLATLARVPWVRRVQIESDLVTDLSGLETLPELEELYAGATVHAAEEPCKNDRSRPERLADLRPLAGLASLRELVLDHTQVEDVSPLASLSGLEGLNLSHTRVKDIRPLARLTRLSSLSLSDLPVDDVTPLASLADLKTLWLRSTKVRTLAPLAGHAKLWYVDVGGSAAFDDLATAATWPGLRALHVWKTAVRDLSPLASCTGLEVLHLADTAVTSLAPIARLPKLSTLHLDGTRVTDLSLLASMGALTYVVLPKGTPAATVDLLRRQRPGLRVDVRPF